ncbi:MAG TPA: hypothetical protein VGV38_08695 [Pyrinomonadaceae bacterium]|nr:hypothetical protein [Pyrinomonadaceae bacterium]
MRFLSLSVARAVVACACVGLAAVAPRAQQTPAAQDKSKQQAVKISGDEKKAEKKFKEAKDLSAKFAAASEFVQKFPASALRQQIAFELVQAITQVRDVPQRITLAENFLNTFSNADETAAVYPMLIGSYVAAGRAEDAFNAASTLLETNPNEAYVLYLLALSGAGEVQRGNRKFEQQTAQYAARAIQLFEANQRPASVGEEEWTKSRNSWLSQLHQSAAVIALTSGKGAEGQASLQKAAALTPNEPQIYYFLAGAKNDEYQQLVQKFKIAPAGPAQEAARKEAEAKLDEVIDLYARVVALTQGNERYKAMHDQTLQDMTAYYRFRHNNSTAGMQELINKYKTPATP